MKTPSNRTKEVAQKNSSRNEDKTNSIKGRGNIKPNRGDNLESKPLLGNFTEDFLSEASYSNDLLGLENSSNNDDTDALMKELASLDFGHTEASRGIGNYSDKNESVFQGSFLANFDQVFGSTKSASEAEWDSLLPSHFLATDFVNDNPPPLISDESTSSVLLPSSANKSAEIKKGGETTFKKVFGLKMLTYF